MSIGAPVAADIPGIFDVLIGGKGYILANSVAPNLPFRTQRARYGYTPTFASRQNVNGDFGDNQQDFWLTASQKDWSLGENQKFYLSGDPSRTRQFWSGTNVDVSIPGQVSIQRVGLTFVATVAGSGSVPSLGRCFTSDATTLYEVSAAGTVTSLGAHGLGNTALAYATDGIYLYISGSACTKTRKMLLSSNVITDFSAQKAESLTFLNNTLFGTSGGNLYQFSTAGAATSLFPWKDATGAALTSTMKIVAFGGVVMILRGAGSHNGAELWIYDGSTKKIAECPGNFSAKDMCIQDGIVWIVGTEGKTGQGTRCALWYYANGSPGVAWTAPNYTTSANTAAAVTPFSGGLLFTDTSNGVLRYYDLSSGGVSSVCSYTASTLMYLSTCDTNVLLTNGSANAMIFPSSAVAATATVTSSLYDFNSSLTKLFRGVIVEWEAATDGNGGSVDISYQVGSVDGSFTSLQASAASGTEYLFGTAVTGRNISIKITLNKGTSTLGPVLKRVYVRAAPLLTKFRNAEYVIDCSGIDGKTPVQLRNGQSHPKSGQSQITDLVTDATSGGLLTIVDRLGSFTGIVELENFEVIEIRPKEFMARLSVRQV